MKKGGSRERAGERYLEDDESRTDNYYVARGNSPVPGLRVLRLKTYCGLLTSKVNEACSTRMKKVRPSIDSPHTPSCNTAYYA